LTIGVGCANFKSKICGNGPDVAISLQNTVNTLKVTADELNAILQKGYDAQIALAYSIAKTALTAAQALLAQSCPDPKDVEAVATTTTEEVQPKASAAKMRAVKLGLIK
jgi:hypothetical protein